MLQTTSARLTELARQAGSADSLTPMTITASRAQGNAVSGAQMLQANQGQVFLLTQFVQQLGGRGAGALLAGTTSPSPDTALRPTTGGFRYFKGGGVTNQAAFASFLRQESKFDNAADPTPNWRNAAPGDVVTYKPKYAVPIPTGHFLYSSSTLGGDFGNFSSAYGFFVDEDTARTLGYSVTASTPSSDHRIGLLSGTSDVTLSGRAGQSIRILDVHVRMQPQVDRPTAGAAATIEIKQLGDVRTLHKFVNNNQGDFFETQFSPADSWFLGQGRDLQVDFTGTDVGSITILYEFVDADEVPKDVFWGSVTPALPSPGLATASLKNPNVSTEIELFYPGQYNLSPTPDAASYARATPIQGEQYIVYGYAVSGQTLNFSGTGAIGTPDQTLLTISSGASPSQISANYFDGGVVGKTMTNKQIAPVFGLTTADLSLNAVVDDVALNCVPNSGRIFVDMSGFGPGTGVLSALTTPANADNGIDALQVSVWGRNGGAQATTPNNPGI